MKLSLLIALSMGAILTGACVASEDAKSSTTLPLTPEKILEHAYILGVAGKRFQEECTPLDLDPWLEGLMHKMQVEQCDMLIKAIHCSYRKLSPTSIINDDELLEISVPLTNGGFTDYSSKKARELCKKRYGIKEDAYWLFLDKNGELKQYINLDKPNDRIDYVPLQKKQ